MPARSARICSAARRLTSVAAGASAASAPHGAFATAHLRESSATGYPHAVLVQREDTYTDSAHPTLISHDEHWTDTDGRVTREVLTSAHRVRTQAYAAIIKTGLLYATKKGQGAWTISVIQLPKAQLRAVTAQFIGFHSLGDVRRHYADLERSATIEKPHLVHVHGRSMIRFVYITMYSKAHWVTYIDPRTGLPIEQTGAGKRTFFHTSLLQPGTLPATFFARPRK